MPRKIAVKSEEETDVEVTPEVSAPVVEVSPLRPVNESSKEELTWLLGELQRLGVRSISDLENLVARTN